MIKKTLDHLARYPRFRVLFIIFLVLLSVVALPMFFGEKKAPQLPPPSHLAQPVSNPSETQALGPEIKDPQAVAATAPKAPPANDGNKSFFSGVFNSEKAHLPAITKITDPEKPSPTPNENTPSIARVDRYDDRISAPVRNPATARPYQETSTLANQMQSYIGTASAAWAFPAMTAVDAVKNSSAQALDPKAQTFQNVMFKAGTVLFAVLLNGLNSDQPGTPVLAQIVSGKFKGAKLMGSFAREDKKLVIKFALMSLPDWPASMSIDAYAIDGDTGANALATHVDSHYLLRYGSLFAAGFLQGFGNAYASANSQCPPHALNCINIGGTTANTVTTKTAAYQGFGQVGTTLGQQVGTQFNTPPTVVVDQGVGIGVLIMTDIPYPNGVPAL